LEPLIAAALASGAAYSRPLSNALVTALTAQRPAAIREFGDLVARSGAPVSVPLNMMQSMPPPQNSMVR